MPFPSVVNDIVKFNSHTQARDKIYRTAQYGLRLLLWDLTKQKGQEWDVVIVKLRKLEAALSVSRKLFRIGNSIDFAQKALDALSTPHPVLCVLGVSSQAFKAIWLILDHIIWFGNVGAAQINVPKWNKWAMRAWLVGLIAATILDIIKLNQLRLKIRRTLQCQKQDEKSDNLPDDLKIELHTLHLNFWRDFCDVFIPLSGLGYTNPGLGAFTGLVSSVIGFQQEWEKHIHPYSPNKIL